MSEQRPGRRPEPAPRAPLPARAGTASRHAASRRAGGIGLAVACAAAALAGTGQARPSDGTVGPGEAHAVLVRSGYRIEVTITPNIAGRIASTFRLRLTRAGRPVAATVSARFTMRAMEMPSLDLRLRPTTPGRYRGDGMKLTMPGRWDILFHILPRHEPPLDVALVDLATVE